MRCRLGWAGLGSPRLEVAHVFEGCRRVDFDSGASANYGSQSKKKKSRWWNVAQIEEDGEDAESDACARAPLRTGEQSQRPTDAGLDASHPQRDLVLLAPILV